MSNVPFALSETDFVTSIERAFRVFVKVQTTASPSPTAIPVMVRPLPETAPTSCSPSLQMPVELYRSPSSASTNASEAACEPVFTCTAPVVSFAGAVALVTPSTFRFTEEYGAGTCWPSDVSYTLTTSIVPVLRALVIVHSTRSP